MIIDILCPRSPSFRECDYEEKGLGGNENTVVLWSRLLKSRGHTVRVFTKSHCQYQGINQLIWLNLSHWNPVEPRDVLISVRSVEPLLVNSQSLLKVLYLGDRKTAGINSITSKVCDLVLVNSLAQLDMYKEIIPNGIDIHIGSCGYDEYYFPGPDEKVRGRCIYTSAPYRGLENTLRLWPSIHKRIPFAELHITGGYDLWGYSKHESEEMRLKDAPSLERNLPGVFLHGALSRVDYAKLIRSAEVFIYPTTYEETCCISILEATAAGVVPVVSSVAALKERVINGVTGQIIDFRPYCTASEKAFVEAIVTYLSSDDFRLKTSTAAQNFAQHHRASKVIENLEKKIIECINKQIPNK